MYKWTDGRDLLKIRFRKVSFVLSSTVSYYIARFSWLLKKEFRLRNCETQIICLFHATYRSSEFLHVYENLQMIRDFHANEVQYLRPLPPPPPQTTSTPKSDSSGSVSKGRDSYYRHRQSPIRLLFDDDYTENLVTTGQGQTHSGNNEFFLARNLKKLARKHVR